VLKVPQELQNSTFCSRKVSRRNTKMFYLQRSLCCKYQINFNCFFSPFVNVI